MRLILSLWLGLVISLGGCSSQPEGQPNPAGNPADDAKKTVLPEAVRHGFGTLRFPDGSYGVTFLGDGKRFAMLNKNCIRIFETASLKEVRGWEADQYALLAIAATPDGKRIATGGNNEMIRLWDADTGKMIREFNKHVGSRVFSLAFSPDGKHLVSFGDEREPGPGVVLAVYRYTDQGLRVWDVETGTELPAFNGGLVAGIHAEFTPDGKNLVWRDERDWREGFGTVHMRPLAGGPDQTWDNKDNTKWVIPFAYPDSGLEPGQSGVVDWHFNIWDGNKERKIVRDKLDQKNDCHPICFSADRRYVASSGQYEGIIVWEPAKGTKQTLLPGKGYYGLDFTRDGRTLIACGDYEIRVFDVVTGKERGEVAEP